MYNAEEQIVLSIGCKVDEEEEEIVELSDGGQVKFNRARKFNECNQHTDTRTDRNASLGNCFQHFFCRLLAVQPPLSYHPDSVALRTTEAYDVRQLAMSKTQQQPLSAFRVNYAATAK